MSGLVKLGQAGLIKDQVKSDQVRSVVVWSG